MKKLSVIFLIILLFVFGCKRDRKSHFSKSEKTKPVNIRIDTLKYRTLKKYIEFSAQPEGITDITIYSQVSGEIVNIYKKMGDRVKKDEVIAEIDNKDLKIQVMQAKANVEAIQQKYQVALKQYETNKNLFEKAKLISQAELENSAGQVKSLEASYNLAQANLLKAQRMLKNSQFLSTEDGIINFIYIKKGELIAAGKPVANIVEPKKLLIKSGISQEDIKGIKKGQEVLIYRKDEKDALKGKITALGIKPIDRANYPIEIEVDNKDLKILPGMIVKVKILKKIYKDVLAVSSMNVLEEFKQKYVYVAKNDIAKKRYIKIKENISGNYIVKSGLQVGELLITEGMENLEDNSKIKIINGRR